MILCLPVYMRAILIAASLASVPEVVKKNFDKPLGNTCSSSLVSSARAVVVKPGATNASSSACALIASITARLPCPRFEQMSWLDRSRYFFPLESVKCEPSAETTCSGLKPFCRRQVP